MDNDGVHVLPTVQDKNSTITLVLIGILIILCLGVIVVVIGYVGLTTGTNLPTNSSETKTNQLNPEIKIEIPSNNSSVDGLVNIKGTATFHFKSLKIELLDENNNRLASGSVSLSTANNQTIPWELQLDIADSPSSGMGRLVVNSDVPEYQEAVKVLFSTSNNSDNLKIYTPLANQLISRPNLSIRGEATGLFEGTLLLRLKDTEDNILYKDFVIIPDQYLEFRAFEYLVNIENLKDAVGKSGNWEFYYQSPRDGSEVILQSIPVRFM